MRSGPSSPIKAAIQKYGESNFACVEVATAGSQVELDSLEIMWIKRLGCVCPGGYNLSGGGEGAGIMHADVKQKLSDAQRAIWTLDKRQTQAEMMRVVYERPELIALHRENSIKLWESSDYADRHSKAVEIAMARPVVKDHLSAVRKNLWLSQEYRDKQARAKADPAEKRRASDASRVRWADPEYKKKVSLAIRASLAVRKAAVV